MANASVIAAVLERLESVTAGAAYFSEVPMSTGAGAVPALPYVVLTDDGTTPDFTLEYDAIEKTGFHVDVFADAATLETTVRKVKYGAGAFNAGGGLDFCDLTVTGQDWKQCVRQSEQRFLEAMRDGSGKLVYRCQIRYEAIAQITS